MTPAPFDDRDGYIWMNGEMKPWREARLHVLSHGLHYASSVFEGLRAYDGNIFKLNAHSKRFIRSGEILDMEMPLTAEEANEISREVLKANNINEGYIRPIAWRGPEQMGVSAPDTQIHVAFACWEWPKYFKDDGTGIALMTSEWRRPDPTTAPVESKAAGIYMIGTIAKHKADRAGYDDVLMHDYKGRIAEASGANIFFLKDGRLITPPAECFLNGITRQTVIAMASEIGVDVEEKHVMPEELAGMEEIFVTGTAAEITPVGKIDDMTFELGPVTRKFMRAYSDLVRQPDKETAVA